MSPLRSWLVNGFITGYLALILLSLIRGSEDWPFCIYPMFASINHRADSQGVEFFTVSHGQEKPVGYGSGLNWGIVLPTMEKKKGWPSEDMRHVLVIALDEFRRQSQRENQPPPDSLKAYTVSYHYPDSGDFQPIVTSKVLLLQVDKGGS